MAKYLSAGNIMSDRIETKANGLSEPHIGGPSLFALAGIRLFTESCRLVCAAGEDYIDTYGAWLTDNGISHKDVLVELEHCNQLILNYENNPKGSFDYRILFGQSHLGYLKTRPSQIADAIDEDTKGIYMAQDTDKIFWEKIAKIKKDHPLTFMWEIEAAIRERTMEQWRYEIDRTLDIVDLFSLNHKEAAFIFGKDPEDEEGMINELMKLPVDMTLFRVGKKGSYCVTKTEAAFCPSIDITTSFDPTGCGNCSTGASLYGFVEGYSPKEIAAIANIAAGFNVQQYGPYPKFTEADTKKAFELIGQFK